MQDIDVYGFTKVPSRHRQNHKNPTVDKSTTTPSRSNFDIFTYQPEDLEILQEDDQEVSKKKHTELDKDQSLYLQGPSSSKGVILPGVPFVVENLDLDVVMNEDMNDLELRDLDLLVQ